jgi:hypothetical protein
MPDTRASNVQRFREDQGAARVHILTAVAPFTVSQDRFVLIEVAEGARLVACTRCTPRTALIHGQTRAIPPDTLARFLDAVNAAEAAWSGDAVPENIHDGVTIIVEWADADAYRRTRMVAPPEGSPHGRLLAAWTDAFEEARRTLR